MPWQILDKIIIFFRLYLSAMVPEKTPNRIAGKYAHMATNPAVKLELVISSMIQTSAIW